MYCPSPQAFDERAKTLRIRNLTQEHSFCAEIDGDGVAVPVWSAGVGVGSFIELYATLGIKKDSSIGTKIIDYDTLVKIHFIGPAAFAVYG
jgi:hypothetical protein